MTHTARRTVLWAAVGIGCLVLGFLLVVVFYGERQTPEQEPPPVTTASTTQATTLPPPPANVFDPADFSYGEDGYLTCSAGDYERGIDVSSFQGEIDWQAVADSGVTFAIIRCGGRGYSQGALYEDSRAQENYLGAKAAGLKVGTYFFSQAISTAEAVEEAEYVLELTEGWELDMPVVYDWEYIDSTARTADVGKQTLTDCMLAFCDRISQEGLRSMIYFNPNHSRDLFHIEQITRYPFWLAMYSDWMTYPYKIDMWQYTCEGTVPGIEGNVDINLYFTYVDEVQ